MATLVATLLSRRLWLVFSSFFLWMAALTVMIPHLTPISVDYFASLEAGVPVSCAGQHSDLDAGLRAKCARGSATAVRYVSFKSFLSDAVLGLLVSPLVGWMSDAYGRKPFFVAGASISIALLSLKLSEAVANTRIHIV